MEHYRVGDQIMYRLTPDGESTWARVDELIWNAGYDLVLGYWVRPDGGASEVRVHPTQIVDPVQTSADATAALERVHRQDREKAVLLDELIGALSYYAKCDGVIRYAPKLDGHRVYKGLEPVQDLVDSYVAKRDHTYRR